MLENSGPHELQHCVELCLSLDEDMFWWYERAAWAMRVRKAST